MHHTRTARSITPHVFLFLLSPLGWLSCCGTQRSARFARVMEYVPELGRAIHVGAAQCVQLLTGSGEGRGTGRIAIQREREFTALLLDSIDHSEGRSGPNRWAFDFAQRVSVFLRKDSQVDYDALRKKIKEARLQARLTKQPNWGGLVAGGMQPMSLTP